MMSLLALSLASLAGQGTEDIAGRYQAWERQLRRRVAELQVMPTAADPTVVGDVVLAFSIGNDGRPANVTIRRSSGVAMYDRAAKRVVRLLGRIGPVPTLSGRRHDVQLKLSYGVPADPDAERRLASTLDAERAAMATRNLAILTGAPNALASAGR